MSAMSLISKRRLPVSSGFAALIIPADASIPSTRPSGTMRGQLSGQRAIAAAQVQDSLVAPQPEPCHQALTPFPLVAGSRPVTEAVELVGLSFPHEDVADEVDVLPFLAVLLGVFHDPGLQHLEAGEVIDEVFLGEIMHRPAGLALEGARLDLAAFAVARFGVCEDGEESQAAFAQRVGTLRHEALAIAFEEQMQHVIAIDGIERSRRHRHVEERALDELDALSLCQLDGFRRYFDARHGHARAREEQRVPAVARTGHEHVAYAMPQEVFAGVYGGDAGRHAPDLPFPAEPSVPVGAHGYRDQL